MVQREARFKHYDYEQAKMIPSRFADQIQPGIFECILNHVVDNERDLSVFESVIVTTIPADFDYAPHSEPVDVLQVRRCVIK